MKCVVINGKKIIIGASAVLCMLVVGLAAYKIAASGESKEVFFSPEDGMKIIENVFPSENEKKEDLNIKIIEENPMFSYDIKKSDMPEATAAPEPAASAAPTPETEPEKVREISSSGKMDMRNESGYEINPSEEAEKKLPFKLTGDGAKVLIMHTHTTECYSSSEKTKYSSAERGRTTNDKKNMIAIGNVIADKLNAAGIKTIHDTTVHDYPTYNKAYTRAAVTIEKNLKENPDIKAVLDIHRDAVPEKGEKIKMTSDVNGVKAAQVMIVAGTDKNGLLHDKWRDNFIFASKLQKEANELYPGLMRNINLRAERFNQQLTPGSLIIEVGSNTNTFEEAETAAAAFADAAAAVLKNSR